MVNTYTSFSFNLLSAALISGGVAIRHMVATASASASGSTSVDEEYLRFPEIHFHIFKNHSMYTQNHSPNIVLLTVKSVYNKVGSGSVQ